MTTIPRRLLLTASLLVVPSVLTACSDHSSMGASTGTSKAADGSAYNGADVSFVQGMIPHHEQAIEMADLALDPASEVSETTKDLARRIRGAQDPEVVQMRGFLKAWGKTEVSDMKDHSAHGMLEGDELKALDDLKGTAFDRRFAALMIKHHEGAVKQSEAVKKDGANPAVRTLADAIIAAQQAEILELRPLAEAT